VVVVEEVVVVVEDDVVVVDEDVVVVDEDVVVVDEDVVVVEEDVVVVVPPPPLLRLRIENIPESLRSVPTAKHGLLLEQLTPLR
jgi:hypothetical protein